jgi:hypothetical protein
MEKDETLVLLDRLSHFAPQDYSDDSLKWSLVGLTPAPEGGLQAHLRCDSGQLESLLVVGHSGRAWLQAVDRLEGECGGLLG